MAASVAGRHNLGRRPHLKATPMTDVTRILSAIEAGDPSAAEQLLPLVYDELRKLAARKMAQEKPGQTLQATALVHEAYLRLVDREEVEHWDSRRHFFSAAAESMRRILIENARRKKRLKRGGQLDRAELPDVAQIDQTPRDELIDLDEALKKLAAEDPEKAEVVNLRFFAGLALEEIGQILGIAVPTVKRHWRYARAWLHKEMQQDVDPGSEI